MSGSPESGKRRFARAPRRSIPALPSERFALLGRLHADPRYLALKSRAKVVLNVGIQTFADGKGHFWPKITTLADTAGVSTATVKRALAELVEAGLISREPYLRPDGLQGSTNYFVDSALVWPSNGEGGSGVRHLVEPERSAPEPRPGQGGSGLSQREGGSGVSHQNRVGTGRKARRKGDGPTNGWITPSEESVPVVTSPELVSPRPTLQERKRAEYHAWLIASTERMMGNAAAAPPAADPDFRTDAAHEGS